MRRSEHQDRNPFPVQSILNHDQETSGEDHPLNLTLVEWEKAIFAGMPLTPADLSSRKLALERPQAQRGIKDVEDFLVLGVAIAHWRVYD